MRRSFNRAKYKELVLYVVSKTEGSPNAGSILMNKILVDCDFTAFREIGFPMTGQKVQHQKMGPISAAFRPVAQEMANEDHSLSEGWGDAYGKPQRRYKALRPANLDLFTQEEIKIVDERIEFWMKMNGRDASLASHDIFGGWTFTDEGEEIPYELAILSMRPLSKEDRDYAFGLLEI